MPEDKKKKTLQIELSVSNDKPWISLFYFFSAINARLDAVTELINPSESVLLKMLEVLPTIPDTEKALAAVFHKKVSQVNELRIFAVGGAT